MSSYDVIVIGSGPAGCSAAVRCRRAGLTVLMLTTEPEPVQETSTVPEPLESIHPGVSSLLHEIGVSGIEQYSMRATYAGIYANSQYAPLGSDGQGEWRGMHISRRMFNSKLLEVMDALGVTVKFEEKVTALIKDEHNVVVGVSSVSGEWRAQYVIDASGKKGIAGKLLNWQRRFFSPPVVCWTGVSAIDDTFSFDSNAAHFIPGDRGWTWLAPQPPQYCAWTRLSAKGEQTFLPPDELRGYTSFDNVVVANMRWRLYRPLCSEGIVLCGDAGGVLDPAAGQGIFNALLSGITAGDTIVACIQQPELAGFHLASYDDWFLQQFELKANQLATYYVEHGIQLNGATEERSNGRTE